MRKIIVVPLTALFLLLAIYAVGNTQSSVADTAKTKIEKSEKKESGQPTKKIAITFDNLPGERIYTPQEREEINLGILAALKKHEAPATGFVIGEFVEGEDWESIVSWLEYGQTIGFHTYTGQDILGIPTSIFISDIVKGREAVEDLVATYKQEGRYFRYPYLHYPTDAASKLEIIDQLVNMGVRIAHVSITTEDFVYNMSLEKTLKMGDSLDLVYLKDEYLNHLSERIASAEDLAQEVAGRPVRQILQLRDNRLNSMFLDDVLAEIEGMGYQFISLQEALRDKFYRTEEEYYGDRGLSYPERVKFTKMK